MTYVQLFFSLSLFLLVKLPSKSDWRLQSDGNMPIKYNLDLPKLSLRHKIARLCLFHKIYHCNPTLRDSLLSLPLYISSRNDHQFKVDVPCCRTNTHFNSFLPRTSSDWNRLPASIVLLVNMHEFKQALVNHFL